MLAMRMIAKYTNVPNALFVKWLVSGVVFLLTSNMMFGQKGVLEMVKIKEHSEGTIKGMSTYRLFLKLDSSHTRVMVVYGNSKYPLVIKSSKPFWNSAFGKAIGYGINPLYAQADPELIYDSWVTIQSDGTCTACPSVMNVEAPNNKWLQPFEDGEDIIIQSEIGGAWFVIDKYSITDNKILLGQFTTSGSLEVLLNVTLIDEETGQKTELTGLECSAK